MSGTTTVDPSAVPFGFAPQQQPLFGPTGTLTQALLGMSAGFGQGAMPSRMPVPFGAAFGQAMGGAAQGLSSAYQDQLRQAQAQQAQMQNQLTQMQLPMMQQKLRFQQQIMSQLNQPGGMQKLMEMFGNQDMSPAGGLPGGAGSAVTPQGSGGPGPAPTGDYASTILDREGSGKNPRSSAQGYGQFIDSTWQSFAQENPQLFAGMTPDQVMAARSDPKLGTTATNWLAQKNATALQTAGVAPSGQSLGLAHYLGAGTTAALMHAPDSASVASVLETTVGADRAQQILKANPELANATAGSLRARYQNVPDPVFLGSATAQPVQVAQAGGGIPAPPGTASQAVAPPSPFGPGAFGTAQPPPPAAATPQGVGAPAASPAPTAAPGAAPGAPHVAAAAAAIPGAVPGNPASLALPSGIAITPQAALAQAQKLNRAAQMNDVLQFAGAPPLFGDSAMLRQQAQIMLKYGLAPSQAGMEEAVRANVQLQIAGPKAYQTKAGELGAQLQLGPQVKAAEAEAVLPTQLLSQGWRLDQNGNPVPTPGGKADPTYKAMVALSEEAARSGVKVTITRDGSVFQGPYRIGGVELDPNTGNYEYKPPPGAPGGAGAVTTRLGPQAEQRAKEIEQQSGEDYKRDQTDAGHLLDQGQALQHQMMSQYAMQDLVNRLDQTGYGGGGRADIANFVDTYLKPILNERATNWIKAMGKLPDAALSQELAKLTTQAAGLQEKSSIGARGSLGLTELFMKNNPGLSTLPDANKMMVNFLLAQNQAQLDYIRGFHDYVASKGPEYRAGKGYTPASETFDHQWLNEDNQKLYVAAATAMTGRPWSDWSKLLGNDPNKVGQVLNIVHRIDPTAEVLDGNGNKMSFPTSGGG